MRTPDMRYGKDVVSVFDGPQCSGHTVGVSRLVTEPFQKDVKLRHSQPSGLGGVVVVPGGGAMSSVSKDG